MKTDPPVGLHPEPVAAERTAKAETSLQETEHKIHQLADQVRDDLKGSA
jgi:hypothetical protein